MELAVGGGCIVEGGGWMELAVGDALWRGMDGAGRGWEMLCRGVWMDGAGRGWGWIYIYKMSVYTGEGCALTCTHCSLQHCPLDDTCELPRELEYYVQSLESRGTYQR